MTQYSKQQATKSFREIVESRRSIRDFLPTAVPQATIQQVLEDARLSPSNSNTQPWMIHIASGTKRDELSEAMLEAFKQRQFSPDFSYAIDDFSDVHIQRARDQGDHYYRACGIAREDREARFAQTLKNFSFFGAPHVAFLFMPSVGDNVRVAGDIGMYGQTFLLSLVANGLGGVPQTAVGMMADIAREKLGVSDEWKLLFSISFGYPAPTELQKTSMPRADLDETVVFHS